MPDDVPAAAEGAAVAAVTAPAYVQLVSAWALNERQAEAALTTPDANGRLPIVVRLGGPGPVRWEPAAVGAGAILFLLLVNPAFEFWVVLIGVAVVMAILSIIGRLFIRVPEGAWGLASVRNRYDRTLVSGVYTVRPTVSLTHLVADREIVFDAPVGGAPSADGVQVSVDVLVTFRVIDPAKFVYQVSVPDFDQFAQAAIADSVRALVRGTTTLDALDIGSEQATRLRSTLGKQTAAFGVEVTGVQFTRITLPPDVAASLEARRLAAIKLDEQAAHFALEKQRLTDKAALETQTQDERRASIEKEAEAEELRLRHLEERLRAHPEAARYDIQMARLGVARDLATNTRAVVGLGGTGELAVAGLLEHGATPPDAVPAAPPATPPPARKTIRRSS